MEIAIFQVDAFSQQPFKGNPAAVCPLTTWLPDSVLQDVAGENNLSETAFFVRSGTQYQLRWFTPSCEVDLCGHATLASAFVLFEHLDHRDPVVCFQTRSGELSVRRSNGRFAMNFPARPPSQTAVHSALLPSLGGSPVEVLAARDYLVRYRTKQEVQELTPALDRLCALDKFAVIVTAPSDKDSDCDFVSRFFAPAKGVPEDPVTGSAHCSLVPYWAAQLGKSELHGRQLSKRGGDIFCRLLNDRVELGGYATLFLRGTIFL